MTIHIHIHADTKTADRAAKDAPRRAYPTLYRTAEVIHSGKFYRVTGADDPSKDATEYLQLDVDGFKRWFPIKELRPVL